MTADIVTAKALPCNWGWGFSMNISSFGRLAWAAIAGVAASVALVGAASAADLGTKPLLKAPPMVRVYSWTGCYVGGFAGWSVANKWQSADSNGYNTANGGVSPWDLSLDSNVLGGGTLGCNWQPTSWLVLGIEGEGGYLHNSGNLNQPLNVGGPGNLNDGVKVGDTYGLVAGRVGVAFDRLLIYGKLGVAFYDSTATVTDSNAPRFAATGSKSQDPFAFGGGGEYAIFDHWTGKAEYMYFEKGSSFNATSGAFNFLQTPSPIQTFKIGLNYKFW